MGRIICLIYEQIHNHLSTHEKKRIQIDPWIRLTEKLVTLNVNLGFFTSWGSLIVSEIELTYGNHSSGNSDYDEQCKF